MAHKTLRFPLTFPDDPVRRACCTECIRTQLAHRPGIQRATVVDDQAAHPPASSPNHNGHEAVIELEYDPDLLSLAQLNRYLMQAGACLKESIALLVLPVSGMTSPRSEQTIQAVLNKLPGVHATASYSSGTIRVEFDRRACALPEIVRKLEPLGVELQPAAAPRPARAAPPSLLRSALRQPDLLTALIGGVCLLVGFLVHVADGPGWLRLALLAVAYVSCGWHTAIGVVRVLAQFRFDIDVLMFAAALGAAALGHYEEGALLLLLFALGGAGERLAIDRARGAIAALTDLMPRTALLLDPAAPGGQREVAVETLSIDDRVLVQPGQRMPADGRVVDGRSAVDQSPITGESMPVDKEPGDEVFAGTINGHCVLTVRVSRLASDNTLAKVVRMVEEAQTTKSPTQLFTDRVEKYYVPAVLIATAALMIIPVLLELEPARPHHSHWQGWFYQAMAFLTAASPCALAIGTPAAVLSGIARAARAGVLIKGGVHLENLSRVRAVAFDKTGTLTEGKPAVTDVIPLTAELNPNRLLALAAAVERSSTHPLAQAIVSEADARGGPALSAVNVHQTPGSGITGVVEGQRISVGRPTQAADLPAIRPLQEQGKTVMLVERDHQPVGLIAVADQIRPGADDVVRQLHQLGIGKTILLTGDNEQTARAVAQRVGIDDFRGQLLPEDKLNTVRELDRQFGRVAMVGDGVNDAPALASATVGIAIGGASVASDVALETADVALLSASLAKLPEAVRISRFARRIITQNLVIALGVIAVLAPLAALGQTPISTAVLFHEGSTVLVVLNALRLLAWRNQALPAPAAR